MMLFLWLVVFEIMIENFSNFFENWLFLFVKRIYLNYLILSKIIIYEYLFFMFFFKIYIFNVKRNIIDLFILFYILLFVLE